MASFWLIGVESIYGGRSSSSLVVANEMSHDFVCGCILRAWRLSILVMNSIAMSSSYGGVACSANVEVNLGAVEYCLVIRSESSVSSFGVSWMENWLAFMSAGAQSRSTSDLLGISSLTDPAAACGEMGRSRPGGS